MTTHLLNRRIYNIINRKNISLELYITCIRVLQNFGVFFRPPQKLPNFAKFGRNFAEILKPEVDSALTPQLFLTSSLCSPWSSTRWSLGIKQ
jgi:hypothetical protein